tara:strand:- start:21190 stop:22200 length:1011 start_codon:yes stop_codon:yes gene_type:complete
LNKKVTVKKLPDWFQIEKYKNTREFDQKDWYRELSFRLYMQNALTSLKKQRDEFSKVKFQKTLLFGFHELLKNPTDTSSAWKRIEEYFEKVLKHYKANSEWSPSSTLSLHNSTLSTNRVKIPEDIDTFLSNYEIFLPLKLKNPIDILSPHSLKILSKTYSEKSVEWCSAQYSEQLKLNPNTDLDLFAEKLSDKLESQSVVSFINTELESRPAESKLEKALLVAGIKSTDELIVVDLLADEDLLVRQFKETISKLKIEKNIRKKSLKATENKLAKLNTYQVLPYIDLRLWEEFNESPISIDSIDATLFPSGIYTIDNAKKLMVEALSISFLHSLISN